MIFCICEDDPVQLERLTRLLTTNLQSQTHHIASFDTPQKLLRFVQKNQVDVLIMDIHLGPDNGIEWVNKVHKYQNDVAVIFITADARYRSAVYEANHVYYLDKPIREADFNQALDKAIRVAKQQARLRSQSQLLVKNKEVHRLIPFHDIVHLESDQRKLMITLHSGEILETYASLNEMMDKLDDRFLQCHKSFAINMDHIEHLNRTRREFHLSDGTIIPISQSRAKDAIETFFVYLENKGIVGL